ncbi:unnamed protein product [Bemisia tabaci]|uniref:DNA polymerase n=1 Tax=Bemisia tabaci TaxID=7038 RepID=A0A9P0CD48_BEMTA|nr:unnamed protein product [Bemisia tabaci]
MCDTDSGGRVKRQRKENHTRLSALERLKAIKSGASKSKYELEPLESVYEEVSEKEYSKKVIERQEDDWIVDDDGAGYVEDGREIFDDDLDEESIQTSKKQKPRSSKKRDRDTVAAESMPGPKGDIKKLLANMPSKKKKEAVCEDDEFFENLIQEVASQDLEAPKPAASKPSSGTYSLYEPVSSNSNTVKTPKFDKLATLKNVKPLTPVLTKIDSPKTNGSCIDSSSFDVSELIDEDIENSFMDSSNFDDGKIEEVSVNTPQISVGEEKFKDIDTKPALSPEPVVKKTSNSAMSNILQTQNDQSFVQVNVDSKNLPLTTDESGKQVFRFFYWDAYEDYYRQPGVVYLFGKVAVPSSNTHISCCVVVRNIERRIYLLPREKKYNRSTNTSTDEEVSMMDVYNEFNNSVSNKYHINQFKSRKVTKNYAFDIPGVPLSSEYLEVRYKATDRALPADLSGETFSHVFGTNTSYLELLLLERKIKGPCWLDIQNAEPISNSISWCKVEAGCSKLEDVNVCANQGPAPPLVVATLNLRTCLNQKTRSNEIVMISCLVHNSFPTDKPAPSPPFQQHFCAMTRPSDKGWPYDSKDIVSQCKVTKLEKMDNERALLGFFLANFFRIDPDLVVGHDLSGFILDILLHRIIYNKTPHWSRLGRLKRTNPPQAGKGRNQSDRYPMCGRLVCDLKITAKELIQKARSFDLGPLCEQVLGLKEDEREEKSPEQIRDMYSSSTKLLHLVKLTMEDTAYMARLMCELNAIPLALQITNIAGNVLSRTLMGGRSERNEFLLLHAFTEKDYIVPDKQYGKKNNLKEEDFDELGEINVNQKASRKTASRKKPTYAGGLVLEPKRGFYDKLILLMDFNSLYPSIIQEYNICFTTISFHSIDLQDEEAFSQVPLPEASSAQGILPQELKKLVESRAVVKNLMKKSGLSSDLKLQYNIRQLALKLTANSMYGCLGFSNSRFYAKALAALVTFKGREILMNTKDLVQKLNYEVIYGDTDSLMINTNCLDLNEVYKIGHKIKSEVNKTYKRLELDLDGIFRYMLLLKKKKYAAVTISKLPNGEVEMKKEVKGLDIVRRDWSKISAMTGEYVLEQILSDQGCDERVINILEKLRKLKEDLESEKVPLDLLWISKNLTKNPEDYADKKALPHVQVALRLNSNAALAKKFRQGDVINYIICEDGTDQPATQRAYHPEELKSNETLKPDIKYYLSQQIHPVVSRLCDPIEGVDSAQIAEHLGLDPSSYRQSTIGRNEDLANGDYSTLGTLTDEERYKNCDKFTFKCSHCSAEIIMDGPSRKTPAGKEELILSKCSNPDCSTPPYLYVSSILNKLTLSMRQYIKKYYAGWLVCEDPACPNRIRKIPSKLERGQPKCTLCHLNSMYREYSEEQLFLQLSFFMSMFDIKNQNEISDLTTAYQRLKLHVDATLKYSAYSVVDLGKLFSGFFPKS